MSCQFKTSNGDVVVPFLLLRLGYWLLVWQSHAIPRLEINRSGRTGKVSNMKRFEGVIPALTGSLNRRNLFRAGAVVAAHSVVAGAVAAQPAAALSPIVTQAAVATVAMSQVSLVPTAGAPTIDVTQAHANRGQLVNIPTYDGSGVVVHPSVYYNADGWSGHKYWMAFTPYSNSNNQIENPSIVCSDDGNTWTVPAGLTNPVVPVVSDPAGGYNSDPNLFVDDAGLMFMFWRANTYNGGEYHYVVTSTDGINWGARTKVRQDSQSVRRLLAPSYTQLADGSWVVYAVDAVRAPRTYVRATAPALTGPWSTPEVCTITGNSAIPWHVDIHRIGAEWQALVQSNVSDGSAGDLWAMVSQDGLNFTAGPKLIGRGTPGVDWDASYYKSAFVPAVRNGVAGWDTWLGGGSFPSSGQIIGRTFVSFDAPAVATQAAPTAASTTVEVLAAKNGLPPWIGSDSFARANAASLGTAESGQVWASSAGTFTISGRGAVPTSSANTRAHFDVSVVDAMATVEITGPNTVQHWLVARLVNGANYYRLGIAWDGRLSLERVTAGAVTILATVLPSAPASGTEISLKCKGSALEAFVNGVTATSVNDSTHAGTSFGIQASATSAKFRNFRLCTV